MADHTHLERTLRILQRLMTHEGVTVRELHDLFDRRESVRTIQRALNAIQAANIPLRVERGAHGEKRYGLERAFDYIPVLLTSDEMLAAMLLSQFSEYFAGTRIGQNIRRVIDKMDQLIPSGCVAVSSALEGVPDTFLFHEPGRMNVRPCGETVQQIFHALVERRVCNIRYGRSGKTFEAHPYSLLLHGGTLYAIVYQPRHQDFIYLSLPRVQAIEIRDESFQRNDNFHLREFLRDRFGLWSAAPRLVRIHFDKTVVLSIVDRIWHSSQAIESLKNGDIILQMQVGLSSELLAWVLRWQHYAEVLEPLELRDQVRDALTRMQARYR